MQTARKIVPQDAHSETRIKSARLEPVSDRPTLVPDEHVSESLEARLIYEVRAEEERRHAIASKQNERPTIRVDAKSTLFGITAQEVPAPPSVTWEPPIEEEDVSLVVDDPRRIAVRVIGVLLLLAIVATILTPIVTRHWRAIQHGLVTLTSRA
jgi:hypothetical protein